jgi:hypothetical protein
MSERPLPDAALAEVRALLQEGRKIEAVKVIRWHTSLGLKEAKDQADAIERELGLPPSPSIQPSGIGCLGVLIVLALIAWFAYRWLIARVQ